MNTYNALPIKRFLNLSYTVAGQQKEHDGGRNSLRTRKTEGQKTQPWHNLSRPEAYERSKAPFNGREQTLQPDRKRAQKLGSTLRRFHKNILRH